MKASLMRFIGASLAVIGVVMALISEYVTHQGARVAVAVSDAHRSMDQATVEVFSKDQVQDLVVRAALIASPSPGLTLAPCLLVLGGAFLWLRANSQSVQRRASP